MNSTVRSSSQKPNQTSKLFPYQRREKLKNLLIIKFMKKYGLKGENEIITNEVSAFIRGETLNESDLKRLDQRINSLLSKKNEHEKLKRELSLDPKSTTEEKLNKDLKLPELDVNKGETMSVRSKMSGASHLSKHSVNKKTEIKIPDRDDSSSVYSKEVNRLDFAEEGDEWNAIAQYNQQMFKNEKILNKYKDHEIKKRTKDELDQQMKDKLLRINEEVVRNAEYDQILLKHVDFLTTKEKERIAEIKSKIYKEKESRDKQLKDEKRRKREEMKKEREYDRQLVKRLEEETEKEKQNAIQKKIMEKESLRNVLIENEVNKKKQQETLQRERLEDIKLTEEYAKVLDKQEKDRENYFKKKEKTSNDFMSLMAMTVIKDMDKKQKEEEEKIRHFQMLKDQMENEEEERKKLEIANNKKEIKKFLDIQVEEKRKMQEYEKALNLEQSRIWKKDTQMFVSQEKEISDVIFKMNKSNQEFLLKQMEEKRKNGQKMNKTEYLLNKNLLEKIKNPPLAGL